MSGAAASPAHGPARVTRNAVETVLFSLRELPAEFDRQGVAARLQAAIQNLYAVLDSDLESPAHFDGLTQASLVLREAIALLAQAGDPRRVPGLQRALSILTTAEARARATSVEVADLQIQNRLNLRRSVVQDGVPKPRPFRASIGVPRLHSLSRRPVAAEVDVSPIVEPMAPQFPPDPPPFPLPKTLEELEAFSRAQLDAINAPPVPAEPEKEEEPPPPPPEPAYIPAVEEGEVVRALARDCLEDIANLSNLRKPIPTETWLDQGPFEQRLLDNLDAFASFGAVGLPLVSLYHAEAENPDAQRAFAVAFSLGCIEGSDTVDIAVAALKQAPPEEHPGFVEGWTLASNPNVDTSLVELLGSPKAAIAGVALEVLGARGTLPADAVEWVLSRKDPVLTRKLARALGTNLAKDAAVAALEPLLRDDADDDLFLAVAESLLRRGYGPTRDRLRAVLAKPKVTPRSHGAAWLLALSGRPDQAEDLVRFVRQHPSPAGVRGVGRLGHASAIEPLIELLAADDDAIVACAAESLDRITGAGLREVVEEPWEIELPPEAEKLDFITKPTRKVEKVVKDPGRWRAWFEASGRELDPGRKWRGGLPFLPLYIVDELEAKVTPPARRADAALELAIVTGRPFRFSPDDWVDRQIEQLAELREIANGLGVAAGAFCFAGAGTTVAPPPNASNRPSPSSKAPSVAPPPRSSARPAPPVAADAPPPAAFAPDGPSPIESAGTKLGLVSYASACAESMVFPERASEVWAKYGLAGPTLDAENAAWRAHFEAHAEEQTEYDYHFKHFRAHWASLRGFQRR